VDGNREMKGGDPCGRTYLFVPLVDRGLMYHGHTNHGNSGGGGDNDIDDPANYTIDFDLVRRVVTDDFQPFLNTHSFVLTCSWLCKCTVIIILSSCSLLVLAILIASISTNYTTSFTLGGYELFLPMNTSWTDAFSSITNYNDFRDMIIVMLLLTVLTIYFHFYPPINSSSVTHEMLANRFFIEEGKSSGQMNIHVLPSSYNNCGSNSGGASSVGVGGNCWNNGKTGRSRYSDQLPTAISNMELAIHRAKYSLDLTVASYMTVYRKKFNVTLKYPHSRLVGSSCVTKHGDRDLLFCSSHGIIDNDAITRKTETDQICYLFPEMIRILPLPRDFVYLHTQASRFMPSLERAIHLHYTATAFQTKIASRAPFNLIDIPIAPTIAPTLFSRTSTSNAAELMEEDRGNNHQQQRLLNLLGAATKAGPIMQRLEWLGDTVLGYLVGLNEFALNSSLTWDVDDLCKIHTKAIQNKTLADAGRTAGLGQIYSPDTTFWRSAYFRDEMQLQSPNVLKIDRDAKGLPFPSGMVTFRLNDKMLSDMVEALLAACYLYGRSSCSVLDGRIVVGLMEVLDLPMPRIIVEEETEQSCNLPSSSSWSYAKSSCIDRGYAFDQDLKWSNAIDKMRKSFAAADDQILINLENGRKSLIKIIGAVSSLDSEVLKRTLECDRAKLLLHCALYDDSHADEQDLIDCALFRDTLHRVGHEALQLAISQQIFHRYPSANERDMTVQRLSAMSNDIVVYIMFKAGIQRVLFDQSTTSIIKFQTCVEEADIRGKDLWTKRGGWILGLEQFYKRFTTTSTTTAVTTTTDTTEPGCGVNEGETSSTLGASTQCQPRYMGIGGGRLLGQHRIDWLITGDLSFSMKTIVGALVLAMGMDGMWACIGPLWEETLLLSAEEIRQQFGCSSSAVMTHFKRDTDSATYI